MSLDSMDDQRSDFRTSSDGIYYKAMTEEFLRKTSKKSYTVLNKLERNVFKIKDNTTKKICILKIILDTQHPFYKFGVKRPSTRSIDFYVLLAKHGLSPEVVDHFEIKGGQVIILEYIPGTLDEKSLADPNITKCIDESIKKLHDLDIVHGDLHSKNIRYRREFTWNTKTDEIRDSVKVYLIDLDVTFFIKEYHEQPFPERWIQEWFDDIENLDEFLEREKVNYKIFVDD